MRRLAVLWIVAAASAWSAEPTLVELSAEQQARAGIVVRPVLERSFGEQQRVVGKVVRTPGSTVTVKVPLTGRIEELLVAPGDAVAAGQVLATLHSHDLLAMQGAMLRAREDSELAARRLEAGRELFSIEGISRLDLELRERQAFAARLEFDTVYRELLDHGMTEVALGAVLASREPDAHLPVASPADGVVLELAVQAHEWIEGFAPLVVIGDPQRVELELQIAPDRVAQVARGDVVEFVPVGRPAATGRATVITQVPQVDPETRTIRIRARISDTDPSMFPGVFVEGTLVHGSARSAPSVPEAAVTRIGGQDVVFVRRGAASFELRPVTLGMFNGSRYEVLAGVAPGDDVVVQGVFFLKSAAVKGAEEGGE